MAANGRNLQDSLLSFVQTNQPDALESLVETYPDRRSLYVDVLDLHQQAPDIAKALFSDPDRVLHTADQAVAGTHDELERVNVRLENHPGLLQLSSVSVRHIEELVTLEGIVDEVGPVIARADGAAFECGSCGSKVRRTVQGLDLDPPAACRECGNRDSFDFLPSRSSYVDSQRITLREPSDAFVDRTAPRRIDIYLDDDLVGTVDESTQVLATGVLRLENDDETVNQFDYYLDTNAVTDEPGAVQEEESDELQDVIEARWKGLVDE